tara:strand:- start:11979 stop:12656 length:678 start_codon:yes stop_codon:yes gene_type:complete
MGWEFCSYTTTVDEVRKPQLFAGNEVGLPKQLDNTLYLSENDAANAICDKLDKLGCMYATFIDFDGANTPLKSARVTRSHAAFKKHSERQRDLTLAAIEKAENLKSRTCPNCKKRVAMQDYHRVFNSFKVSVSHSPYHSSLNGACPHCGNNTLPLTRAQRQSIEKVREKASNAYDTWRNEQDEAVRAMHKAGKVGTKAVVVGLLHEIDARPYNDEHFDEDECDDF